MKRAGFSSTAILFLLLGIAIPGYAQREQKGEEHGKPQPAQQHQQAQSAQPQHAQAAPQQHQQPAQQQPRQQANKPAQPQGKPPQKAQQKYGGAYHGGVQPNAPTYGGVHPSGVPQHQKQVRSGFGQSRATSWDKDHRTWGQRGGYNGYRVPEDRFKLYFGSNHYFRINGLPMVFVGGYPRFQYDGYWVTFVDPWPETWPATWYQSDDVYLDYTNDGYYVYDRRHPGPGIAVTIAF
jgi:hypothetical protein